MDLDGIRVLDLTQLLPGPYATQLLADSGAEVLKIEAPDRGDGARSLAPETARGTGVIFEMVNRGKRSVAIDLKSERGRTAFYRLVADADAVFEGFRPGVASRLSIDYDTLSAYNDELIYCSLTGYGQDGPWADRAGHDLNYVGLAGLLDMTRDSPAEKPRIPGYPIADMAGGLFAAYAIVQALLSRELGNGDGDYIDVAMADVVASFAQPVAYRTLTDELPEPRPGETALTGRLPWYDCYETADGRWMTLATLEEPFWRAFCEAVDRDHLVDKHAVHDPDVLAAVREELAAVFRERTRDEWEAFLDDVDTAVSGVYAPAEMADHPQISARDLVADSGDRPPRIGFPARTSDGRASHGETVPELGEHTESVLRSVGYDDAGIEALRTADVIP